MKKLQNSIAWLVVAVGLGVSVWMPDANADEIHLAASYSTEHIQGMRAGYRWTDGPKLLPESWFTLVGSPRVHWEVAANTWVNSRAADDRINAVTFSPVLQWLLKDTARPLFLELGIGVSLLDDQKISDRDLSISFQFEDRISLSWQYDPASNARLSLGYSHYSQADIKRPNDGLDLWTLTWHLPL